MPTNLASSANATATLGSSISVSSSSPPLITGSASANETLPALTSSSAVSMPTNATLPTSSSLSSNESSSTQTASTNTASPTPSSDSNILPTDPNDLSNDPNDGIFFSPSVASRSLIYAYDEERNRTVARSAKWTTRWDDILGPSETDAAHLQRRQATACGPPANAAQVETYVLDCDRFPNICQNACFFMVCKATGIQAAVPGMDNTIQITLDRNNGGRAQGECRGDNKCSATVTPRKASGWNKMSQAKRQCDEFPFNIARPGGPEAATRCVPGSENGAQGNDLKFFINAQGPYKVGTNGQRSQIPDCALVNIQLNNVPPNSLCQ
ncbi:hypothetical protein JB92DRAFT_928952 [Gautieria morchelliformis]|nr:hypothetical protein JB92DRAFT_928952 [Gautieria morchelliformis]